jgi:poly(3-hydroxybutyrate) depolymerase
LLRALDPPSDALDATQAIWRFFAAHGRACA